MTKEKQPSLPGRAKPVRGILFDRQSRPALLVCAIGLCMTLIACAYEIRASHRVERERFKLLTDALAMETETQISALAQMLRSGASLIAASDLVTPEEWQKFILFGNHQKQLQDINLFGYVQTIHDQNQIQAAKAAAPPAVAEQLSAPELARKFPISILLFAHPGPPNQRLRDRLAALMISAPFAKYLTAPPATDDVVLLHTNHSLRDGTPASPGKLSNFAIMLLPMFDRDGTQDGNSTVDVVSSRLQGVLFAEFELSVFANALSNVHSSFFNNEVKLNIRSPNVPEPASTPAPQRTGSGTLYTPTHTRTVELNAYGAPWLLKFSSTPRFDSSGIRYVPNIILSVGFLSTFLLSSLIWSFNRRKADAIEGEQRLLTMLNVATDAIIITDNKFNVAMFNKSAERIFGYPPGEIIGQNVTILAPEAMRAESVELLAQFAQSPDSAYKISNHNGTFGLHKSGRQFPTDAAISKVGDDADRLYTIVVRDITDLKAYEKKIDFLIQELEHRSKNLASLILAIARETAAADAPDFMTHFSERIAASIACHNLFTSSGRTAIELCTLIKSQIPHFVSGPNQRIFMTGPDVTIASTAAQSIGMAIYELGVNASKYGALSTAEGRVQIHWRLERTSEGEYFFMEWTEIGGPLVDVPKRIGFGMTAIKGMLEFALEADVTIDYDPAGLIWRLKCRASQILAETPPGAGMT